MTKKRNPKCCTVGELRKFTERAKRVIGPNPDWTRPGNGFATNSCAAMMELSTYCGCQFIVLAEQMNDSAIWRYVLRSGRLSPHQIRYVGEQGKIDWSNLFDVLDDTEGMFSNKKDKKGKGQNIFPKPYQREDVLSYMKTSKHRYVFARGIETGVLTRYDILKILRSKKYLESSSVQWAIINTKLLTQEEVIALLHHYDGQCLDLSVKEYFLAYEPRGKQLEEFIDATLKIDPSKVKDICQAAYEIPNHGLSKEYELDLFRNGYLKKQVARSASAGSGCYNPFDEI